MLSFCVYVLYVMHFKKKMVVTLLNVETVGNTIVYNVIIELNILTYIVTKITVAKKQIKTRNKKVVMLWILKKQRKKKKQIITKKFVAQNVKLNQDTV